MARIRFGCRRDRCPLGRSQPCSLLPRRKFARRATWSIACIPARIRVPRFVICVKRARRRSERGCFREVAEARRFAERSRELDRRYSLSLIGTARNRAAALTLPSPASGRGFYKE